MAVISSKREFAEKKQIRREVFLAPRYPAWLTGSNYYSIAIIVSLAIGLFAFLLVNEELYLSLIVGGGVFAIVFFAALSYRKKLLKKHLEQFNNEQQLQRKLKKISIKNKPQTANKLTLEDNALVVNEIIRKSKAAQVLKNLPSAHLEMFEMCEQYLKRNKSELESVSPGSPRLASLQKSRRDVKNIHKYHLLAWASLESGQYIEKANSASEVDKKMDFSEKAVKVIGAAMSFYPEEKLLIESNKAVKSFIAESKINYLIEEAEQYERKGDSELALASYKQAAEELEKSKQFINNLTFYKKIQDNIDRLYNIGL